MIQNLHELTPHVGSRALSLECLFFFNTLECVVKQSYFRPKLSHISRFFVPVFKAVCSLVSVVMSTVACLHSLAVQSERVLQAYANDSLPLLETFVSVFNTVVS